MLGRIAYAIRLIVFRKMLMETKNESRLSTEERAQLKAKKARDLKLKKTQAEVRRKYFDYYDDVKTNIKEDW